MKKLVLEDKEERLTDQQKEGLIETYDSNLEELDEEFRNNNTTVHDFFIGLASWIIALFWFLSLVAIIVLFFN